MNKCCNSTIATWLPHMNIQHHLVDSLHRDSPPSPSSPSPSSILRFARTPRSQVSPRWGQAPPLFPSVSPGALPWQRDQPAKHAGETCVIIYRCLLYGADYWCKTFNCWNYGDGNNIKCGNNLVQFVCNDIIYWIEVILVTGNFHAWICNYLCLKLNSANTTTHSNL